MQSEVLQEVAQESLPLEEANAEIEANEVVPVSEDETVESSENEQPAEQSEVIDEDAEADESDEQVEEPVDAIEPEASEDSLVEKPKTLAEEVTALRSRLDAEVRARAIETKAILAEREEMLGKIKHMEEQAEEREIVIEGLEEELDNAHAAVKTIKDSLENPAAFAEAVAGIEDPIDDSAGVEDAQSSIVEEYLSIKDPREKTRFWKEHQEEIKAEQVRK